MKKNKEHKKGESTIGKIIYGFLLFMPLFAIGVTCLTNIFNKEDSLTTESKYQTNDVTNSNDLINGNIYQLTLNQAPTDTSLITLGTFYAFYNVNYRGQDINVDAQANNNVNYIIIRSNSTTIYFSNETYNIITTIEFSSITFPYSFNVVVRSLTSENANTLVNNYNASYSDYNIVDNVIESPRENVFYRAVDKVTESQLFSWATNSVIYTTMNATCTQLSITAPFIPLLLSYWLIISVIYFLYDIALMLIWLLHDKIHEMRDSLA